MSKDKSLIILVHGTYGEDPEWKEAKSPMPKYIEENLDFSCTFYPYKWEAPNTNKARLEGAKKLKEILVEFYEKNEYKDISIIGHSHGGNVALYAVGMLDNPNIVSKIICLGTPFLHFDKNSYKDKLWVLCFFTYLAGFRFVFNNVTINKDNPVKMEDLITLFIYSISFIVLYYFLSNLIRKFIHKRILALSYPKDLEIGILNIRYKIDEVVFYLTGMNKFFSYPLKFYKISSIIMIISFIILSPGLYLLDHKAEILMNSYPLSLTIFITILTMGALMFFVPTVMIFVYTFSYRLLLLGVDLIKHSPIVFGKESVFFSFFSGLDANHKMPQISANQYDKKLEENSKILSLKHSNYFSDQEALEGVTNFLRTENIERKTISK